MPEQAPQQFKYGAFISYSHADEATARWLHRRLESYRGPSGAAALRGRWGPAPVRIGKVFRDREEFAAGGELKAQIETALRDSAYLVVLCSPRSAQSVYVESEIQFFRNLGRADRIIPIIVEGEPSECFPAPLKHDVERLGADLREGKDERERGSLKVIAGILGVGLDDLIQRERAAQRTRVAILSGALAFVALLAVAAGWQAFVAQAERNRALGALGRVFAERGWRAHENGQSSLAARYALAGLRIAPGNGAEFRALLASIVQQPSEERTVAVPLGTEVVWIAPDGAEFGVFAGDEGGVTYDVVDTASLHSREVGEMPSPLVLAVSPDARAILVHAFAEQTSEVWRSDRHGAQIRMDRSFVSGAFTADGRFLAADQNQVTLYSRTGRVLQTIGTPGTQYACCVAITPDGAIAVTTEVHQEPTLSRTSLYGRVWRRTRDGYVEASSFNATGTPAGYRISGNGARLLIRYDDEDSAASVSLNSRGRDWVTLEGHGGAITDMDITADGARVVTASNDGSVRIWDADTGVELARNTRHNGAVRIVRFSSSGDTVFSSGEDNTMRSWHWQSRDRVLLGNGECTGEIAPLPHANAFACGSEGGASLYNLDQSVSTVPVWRGYAAHWGWIKLDPPYDGAPSAYGVAVRPSGDEIAIAGPEEDGVSLFPIGEGAHPTQTIRMIEHSPAAIPAPSLKLDVAGGATAVAYAPNGEMLATASARGEVILFSRTGRRIRTLSSGAGVSDLAFDSSGTHLAISTANGDIFVWPTNGDHQPLRFRAHSGAASALAFTPSGEEIVSGGADGTVVVWNARNGQRLRVMRGHEGAVRDVSVSGALAASAGEDNAVVVWDLATGRAVARFGGGRNAYTRYVAFTPDGAALFASGLSITEMHSVAALHSPLEDLVNQVCAGALAGDGGRFSDAERDADPLIDEVWLAQSRSGEVCQAN